MTESFQKDAPETRGAILGLFLTRWRGRLRDGGATW